MDVLDEVRERLLELAAESRNTHLLMRLVDLGIEIAETAQTMLKLRLREEQEQGGA